MKIVKVSVRSGATFSNPVERFSNFQTSVTLEAELKEDDNLAYEVRLLQLQADSMSAQHRDQLENVARSKAKLRAEDLDDENDMPNF